MPEPGPPLAPLLDKLTDSLTGEFPKTTPRRTCGATAFSGKATAVIGMRRAGKTTFVHQLRQQRFDAGAPRESLPYLNFEDERLALFPARLLHLVVEDYYRRYPDLRQRQSVMWCFDEIQSINGWETFVRRLLDDERVEVFVTGSSAALLSREIATSLRGRAWEVLIHPFSFEESRDHAGAVVPVDTLRLSSAARSRHEAAFLEYLQSGGFPEAQGLDSATRFRLLRDYVDVAMLRDIVERYGVTNVVGLRWLVRHLLANPASLFSVEKFFAALKSQGIAIGKDTVHALLDHLQDCFLVRTVWMESDSERQRMVNPRKAYPIDPGLIPVFDRSGRKNIGHALETAVFIELERRLADITYVRTSGGYEVDFLARYPNGSSELLQVCAVAREAHTAEREVRALLEAGSAFPMAHKLILTATADGMPLIELPHDVEAMPAYVWMVRGND